MNQSSSVVSHSFLQPRVVTHIESRRTGIERQRVKSTHHHGAVYDCAAEAIVRRCQHEHPTLDTALICAGQMIHAERAPACPKPLPA